MTGRIDTRPCFFSSLLFGSAFALCMSLAPGCMEAKRSIQPDAGGIDENKYESARDGGRPVKEEGSMKPLEFIRWDGKFSDQWDKVEKLKDEQKYQSALNLVMKILRRAESEKKAEERVRAMLEAAGFMMSLDRMEDALKFLRGQRKPSDLLGRVVYDMYYSETLLDYLNMYQWEIQGREKSGSTDASDVRSWTVRQIFEEASEALQELWQHRSQLGRIGLDELPDLYFRKGDYPRHVRPTLRDIVTYRWIEILQDRRGWTPLQRNTVFELSLKELLKRPEASAEGADLTGSGLHPLSRISIILRDHEHWHAASGRREAAFEARLKLLESLWSSVDNDDDKRVIIASLENELKKVRDLPWWAMGAADMAEWTSLSGQPDSLTTARRIALDCLEKFSRTKGGERCRHLIESIERPDFSLQGMAADSAGKPSLVVRHKNLKKVFFRAYRMDLMKQIASARDYNLFPGWSEVQSIMKRHRPAYEWHQDLPPTKDYRFHKTFVVPPMKEPGYYLVLASGNKSFSPEDNFMTGLNFIVTDMAVVTSVQGGCLYVTVVSAKDGSPIQDAEVSLYRFDWRYGRKHRVVSRVETGPDGTARFTGNSNSNYFVLAKKDGQVALDPSYMYLYSNVSAGERRTTASLVYTDRSIYRPGQTVHYKVVLYSGSRKKADYHTLASTPVTVLLVDANSREVARKNLTTNSMGTASGSFEVPAGRLLGNWAIRTIPEGYASIKVEEYKRPTFEVELKGPDKGLRLNQPAVVKGSARYYFGLPVSSGTVTWRVERTPNYPWWWGWWYGTPNTQAQHVASGKGKLQEDGSFEIRFKPRADERDAEQGVTYNFRISVDVTDEGGETRSQTRNYRVGFSAVEAVLLMEQGFIDAGKSTIIKAKRTSLDGTPIKGNARWILKGLVQPDETPLPADIPLHRGVGKAGKAAMGFETPGDRHRPRWSHGYDPLAVMRDWPEGEIVAHARISHGLDGDADIVLPELRAGAYRLCYETEDDFGKTFKTCRDLLVQGRDARFALPALLEIQDGSVEVGGTARLLAASGLEGQVLFLDLYRDGVLTERRRLISNGRSQVIEIPVSEKMRGGFGVVLWTVMDHQFVSFQRSVFVPWSNKQLRVSFSSFRDKLRPGSQETWTVTVKAGHGKDSAVAGAEVLAYMYDRSLDLFATHYPPDPIEVFPTRSATAQYKSSLGPGSAVWVQCNGFKRPSSYSMFAPPRFEPDIGWGVISGHGYSGVGYGGGGGMAFRAIRSAPKKRAKTKGMALEAEGDISPLAVPAEAENRAEAGAVLDETATRPVSQGPEVQLRENFAETAFFMPHLVTGRDGSVKIEFEVPDSVTSWRVFVQAITRDMSSGTIEKEARSVKELMIRPYLPRFFREGDRVVLKVMVNNASSADMNGVVELAVLDPGDERNVSSKFGLVSNQAEYHVSAGKSATVSFELHVPLEVGLFAFKVVARSGNLSDGELRPIPVLPGRMHLMQSRFVALKGGATRILKFDDMARGDDPTRRDEQLVVTLDAQLFYSVLSSVPYLVEYPYECTEQLLNRFLSAGILATMFDEYPGVAKMAEKLASRKTRFERFDRTDPNRKMALEETPWLQQALGGRETEDELIAILDPEVARENRMSAMDKLEKAQTASGGFPWFPGGPPDPYITLYILYGFSKGLEFGLDVPDDMIQRAWAYEKEHYLDRLVKTCMAGDSCWDMITYLNYVLSGYRDLELAAEAFSEEDRAKMLDFSFKHWKKHSLLLKGYLALTLLRAGRRSDAELVWGSVMDAMKTDPDLGSYWAPEERSWLWYNDAIETHAFAIRVLTELNPSDPRIDRLVQWIMLNKKMNHWKSTKATAEVVYSLARYMKAKNLLGARESATVKLGDMEKRFEFDPRDYTGKSNHVVVKGDDLKPEKCSEIEVQNRGKSLMFASATWHFSTEKVPAGSKGDMLHVERTFFKRVKTGEEITLVPLKPGDHVEVGDEVEVHLSLRSKSPVGYVHVRDPRPAGFEPVSMVSRHRWNLGLYWYEEVRDSGMNFFFDKLPSGEFTLIHRIRAATAGTFKVAPATMQPMYAPEFSAYSSGYVMNID